MEQKVPGEGHGQGEARPGAEETRREEYLGTELLGAF